MVVKQTMDTLAPIIFTSARVTSTTDRSNTGLAGVDHMCRYVMANRGATEDLCARRGRVGDVSARDRGGPEARNGATRIENAYGCRCGRQHADAARQRQQGAVSRGERVTHLACTIGVGSV